MIEKKEQVSSSFWYYRTIKENYNVQNIVMDAFQVLSNNFNHRKDI